MSMSEENSAISEQQKKRTAELEALRARLIAAEESGFSKRTPEEIRQAAKAKLKSNDDL
ncbi:hypothetical protein [Hyphomonas atlantica]|uniref:Uncharacterized protein n=1 Tax=Hyphomonas atlantica TaxID=1280948 RepID=A0A059E1M7_9PROT|nr:hypothetical protein [Hyphomonas atlantica]KCZ61432.1 hypothetical protein HY36_16820 [Hyphomonas atlantica]